MAYDKKFKRRAIEYMEEGNTQEATAKIFGIGTTTLKEWKKQHKTTGDFPIKIRQRSPKKLPPDDLKRYMETHPDAYLSEIAEHFGCTGEAVRQMLDKLKITRKKRR